MITWETFLGVEKWINANENTFNLSTEISHLCYKLHLKIKLGETGWEKKKPLYPAKNFTFKTAVIVVKHHCRQLEKIFCCVWLKEIWMQLRPRLMSRPRMCERTRVHASPFPVPVWEKKGAIEWVHALFLLGFTYWADKQSIPIKASCRPGVCRKGLCSIGSHHPFNQKKQKKKQPSNTGWLWPEGSGGPSGADTAWSIEMHGKSGRLVPTGSSQKSTSENGWGGRRGKEWRGLRLWLHVGVVSWGKGEAN